MKKSLIICVIALCGALTLFAGVSGTESGTGGSGTDPSAITNAATINGASAAADYGVSNKTIFLKAFTPGAGTTVTDTGTSLVFTVTGVAYTASNNTYTSGTTQAMAYATQNGVSILDQTNTVTSITGKSFSTIAYGVGAQLIGSPGASSNATLALTTSIRTVTVTNTPANINAISSSPGSGFARTDLICSTNGALITFSGSSFRFPYGYSPAILNQNKDTNIFLWANMGSSGPLINIATYYSRDPRTRTFPSFGINTFQTNSARVSNYTAIFKLNGATTGTPILEVRNAQNATLGRFALQTQASTNDVSLGGITIQPNESFVLTNLSTGSGTSITLITNILTEITIN